MKWIQDLRALLRRVKGQKASTIAPGSEVSCEEALERLFEWLDGELEGEDAEAVGGHLEMCGRCYPVLTFERAFQEALERAKSEPEAPAGLRSSIMASLTDEGFRSG
jgi:anti-sigma factor (TIGR02949 family)